MNKEVFLRELQARIQVLAASEQQDILAEYTQHIDLRTAGGLTEEEAIRDFGDLDALAAEILEAYHVDPAYSARPHGVRVVSLPDPRPALRRGCAAVGRFFRRVRRGLGRFFRLCGGKGKALFRRPKPESREKKEKTKMEQTDMRRPAPSGAAHTLGLAASRAGRGLGRLCRAVLRLVWNLVLLVCAVPFAVAGLAAVICLGVLLVLLVQGYPLAGALLVCLGGAACCAAVLGLGGTLIWRRPAAAAAPAETAAPAAPQPPASPAASTEELEAAVALARQVVEEVLTPAPETAPQALVPEAAAAPGGETSPDAPAPAPDRESKEVPHA